MNANLTVERKSLAEEVTNRLQESIRLGGFPVGGKLPTEPQLMRAYGVGRSTVREAIKVLSNTGMLRVQQGVGTFVASQFATAEPMSQRLKRASASDLDDVRQILEMKIAEKAALKRTQSDIKSMKAKLAEIEKADASGSLEACIDADIAFHAAVAAASHNEILLEFYELASDRLRQWYKSIYSSADIFVSAFGLHKALLESIVARDARKSWNLAEEIIRHGQV